VRIAVNDSDVLTVDTTGAALVGNLTLSGGAQILGLEELSNNGVGITLDSSDDSMDIDAAPGGLSITGSTVITGTLAATVGSTYDLGSAAEYWRSAYADHTVHAVMTVTGTGTTLAATDPELVEFTVGSAYTVTLPAVASASPGRRFVLKDNGSASAVNVLTIDGNGAETIDGAANVTIVLAYQSYTVFLNAAGTAWLLENRP
jgi:hypothetical protein